MLSYKFGIGAFVIIKATGAVGIVKLNGGLGWDTDYRVLVGGEIKVYNENELEEAY